MPNTSKGFPYPVATDDPNIPADIQALAQAIDTHLNNYSQTTHTHTGVYATSAHNHDGVYSISAHVHSNYLTSADLAGYSPTTHNHDSSYATTGHTHSDYIATSLISSTKGSMPVGTGTGVSTITPGANDYALLSDSSTSTGLKWASLAAVGTVIPNTFSNIAVSGQTTVSADQQSDTLTLTAGSNITLTTNNTTNTVTITGSNAGVTTHEAAADPHAQYLTTTEANSVYEQIGAASLAQSAAAAYTDTAISNLVNSAPTTLDTLKELSDALGGDAAFATTVTNSIAAKAPLASPTFTGTVTIPSGASISGFAPLSSPTFTGTVTLPGDPSSSLHAATKQYVDNTASGVVAKPQVLGATTANIDATYSNGTDGVGATLTHNTNGVFPSGAGGASGWAVGKGILLKNQTNKAQNGRYYISNMGSVSTPYVLTRCTYCDEASEIPGAYIFVQDGTNAGTGWIQVVEDPATFVVGTDNIDVFQFSGSGTYTAGTGLTLTSNEYSINTSVTADLSTAQTLTNKTLTSPVINTPTGITKSDVGLANLDNTSDANKPVSTATQTALDAKAPLASPTFTGTVSASTVSVSGNLVSHITINPQTASYVLDISDDGKIVEMSVSAGNTVTIPPSSSQNFTIGSQIIIVQSGTGKTTIQQGSGVTINSRGNVATAPELAGQWASCVLIYRGSNSWLVTGDIA
jgi:hypothetical protein